MMRITLSIQCKQREAKLRKKKTNCNFKEVKKIERTYFDEFDKKTRI